MRKIFFLLAVSFLSVGILNAAILNVPAEYSTIQIGIDSSSVGDTVLVQPGTYVENINYNGKNITVASLFLTTSDTSYISQTVIDGDQNGTVVIFNSGEDTTAVLTGFTVTNGYIQSGHPTIHGGGIRCENASPKIAYSYIVNNFSHNDGGGFYCSDCSPIMEYLIIKGNVTEWDGAGIYCNYAHPSLYRVLICNNIASWGGAAVYLTVQSVPTFTNVTMTENISYNNIYHYAGFQLAHESSPTLVNCILWDNTPQEIILASGSSIDITYSDIEGGWTGLENMNSNPLFVDPLDGDFHLTAESPCIDQGDPDTPSDPDGSISDIGSYYFDPNYFYANFSASSTVGEAPLEVNFSDISNGNVISWQWDFQNDGIIDSYEQNPSFVYDNKGTYSVSLTVQDIVKEDVLIKENYIAVTSNIVVDGYAFLDNQSVHDGINVLFMRTAPSTMSDSTFTDSTGYYTIDLQNGLYDITYSKESYHDGSFANKLLDSDTTLTSVTLISQGTGIIYVPTEFSTIQSAINNAFDGNVVLVDTGRYYENINFGGKSITVSSLFLIVQDSTYITNTIIDANQNGTAVKFINGEDSLSCLNGFTITGSYNADNGGVYCFGSNPILKNLIVSGNNAFFNGGGISCYNADPTIINVVIKNNTVTMVDGGGFFCTEGSKPTLINVSIYNNSAGMFGGGFACWSNSQPSLYNVDIHDNSADQCGGVYCHNSIVFITNATICHNSSVMHHNSSGIYSVYMANVYVTNCIIWDNWPAEIQTNIGGSITITYSDIKDGWSGTGNIDSDPLFADPQNGDFHLTWANFPIPDLTKSPCIDTGDPSSPVDPDGTRADMGAYYFNQPEFGVDIPTSLEANILHKNFPNPTKNSTTIKYSLKQNSHVDICIYNIKGQLVSKLVNESKLKGEHTLFYNTEALRSGVYFYKIQTDDMSEIRKMIVIK